ncbi:hypothetical protein A0H81_08387 [Grifola frondosa]|uniref:RING-type domain-containing protein n=1 Tax=Grifola frondosa TaxID=5627 RepID=A0A1C7M4F2_GRIFR|nr:hypothetical protein A0H81_08387 [Grifola frondosa]
MPEPQDPLRWRKTHVPQLQPSHRRWGAMLIRPGAQATGPDKTPGARQRSTVASGERPRRRPRNRDPVGPTRRGDHQARVQAQNAGIAVQQQQQLHSNPGPGSVSSTAAFPQETLTIINEGIPPPYNSRQQDVRPFRVESRNISSQLQRGQQQGGVVDYSQVRDTSYDATSHPPPSVDFAYNVHTSPTYINSAEKDFHEKAEQKEIIAAEPGLQFTRETWWDALLIQYGRMHHGTSVITDGLRKTISLHITGSLHALFRSAPHWLNFINLPRFFGTLLDPRTRNTLQPSLILSALAIATFFQSSESDEGLPGREKALTLREQAQGALEASLNAGWIDRGLVQASWIICHFIMQLIAFFEISAHPLHCTDRVRSSMAMLDSLIRSLSLTTLDAHDPRVSIFPARLVPTVPAYSHSEGVSEDHPVSHRHHQSDPRLGAQECSCSSYTLGKTWPHVSRCAPLWSSTPAWIDGPESELRKEECRRLVWSALMLTASHSSYTAASSDIAIQQLFIMDPANYALLFPGESLGRIRGYPSSPSKDSVWALYIRTMLLWHSCLRMRGDASYPEAEKTQFAVSAWLELDNIEEALDKHSCGIERAFLFQGREILFNSRMCISFEFQRYIPQATAVSNANLAAISQKGGGMASLTLALDVAKAFLSPTEYLMELWPCPEQHRRYNMLRDKLTDACYAAGVPPPTPGVEILYLDRFRMYYFKLEVLRTYAIGNISDLTVFEASSSGATLKRRASLTFEGMQDDSSRKRAREDLGEYKGICESDQNAAVDGVALANNLEEELQCGCCSALVYRPVVVSPCQHFFCGSCIHMWIRNGGTNCPACRSMSTGVTFSRPIQTIVDILLRAAPSKARSTNERVQADAIYHPGVSLRIPSPGKLLPNQTCLQAIAYIFVHARIAWLETHGDGDVLNPSWILKWTKITHGSLKMALHQVTDFVVIGDENVLALQAPTTTKCDFCQVSFCGVGIPTRCVAAPLALQHPNGLADYSDFIRAAKSTIASTGLSPRHIYREIVAHIQNQPRQFAPLFELDLFLDVHPVAGGMDPDPNAPRHRICRMCATEVLLWGLRDWWVRERKKGFLEEHVMSRPDCPEGSNCARQKDHAHAKEFNHIIAPPEIQLGSQAQVGPAPQAGASQVVSVEMIPTIPLASDPDFAFSSQLSVGDVSAPSSQDLSQDFRDEVDALL